MILRRAPRHGPAILFVASCLLSATVASAQATGGTVPADATLELRLLSDVGSYGSRVNDPIHGVVISPVVVQSRVLVPAGARMEGRVTRVRSVGLGFRRETARLAFSFDSLRLSANASPIAVKSRLLGIDNSRENVDAEGVVRGIRSAGTFANKLSGISTVTAIEPTLFLYTFAAFSSILRFAEPEIFYPRGTEVFVKVETPFDVTAVLPPVPGVARSAADERELGRIVRGLPFRTATPKGTPSDLTNVLLIGTAEEVASSFRAAGWVSADDLSFQTGFETFRVMLVKTGYSQAPMSELRLDGVPSATTWQKGLNTFDKRHHLRVFVTKDTWKGRPVWTVSSTQDIGIGFSKETRTLIHIIDEHIDTERDKAMNDLAAAGCVRGLSYVARPWVPQNAVNATGDRLITNGAIGVVDLSACEPSGSSGWGDVDGARPLKARGGPAARTVRQIFLTLKEDVVRNNIAYLGYQGIKWMIGFAKPSRPDRPPARSVAVDGVIYVIEEPGSPAIQAKPEKGGGR